MAGLLPIVAAALAQAGAPARGVIVPAASIVGDDDATALETNPGALGFSASNVTLLVADLDDAGRQVGGGVALLGNLRIGSLSNALGFQWLRPPGPTGVSSGNKLSYAFGFRGGRSFGAGMGFHWFSSDDDARLDGLMTVDLGLTVRPLSLVGLGYVVRQLNTPLRGRDALGNAIVYERVHDFEAALRPLGGDRFEVAGGAAVGETTGDATPHARAALGVLRGVTLRGDVFVEDGDFDGDGAEERDVRGTAGLALDLDRAGVFGAGVFGRRSAGGARLPGGANLGFVAGLRVGEEHYRPAPIVPRRVELIALEGDLSERGLVDLVEHLRDLRRDGDCAGVVVRPVGFEPGWATVEELRAGMAALRASGKRVIVLLGETSMREMYLATAADRVLVEPTGGVRLVGLRASVTFLKGTLDRLGVRADVLKIAEYKSAPEPLTRTESSGPAREMRESLLDDVFARFVATVARDRRLTEARLRDLIERGPYTAKEALAAGLVDEIVAPEYLEDWLDDRVGTVRLEDPYEPGTVRPHRWSSRPRVAVIFVEGDLVEGESQRMPVVGALAGGDTIAEAIEDARDDPTVHAIVVRVNSPGGVVGGADLIWRELRKAQEKKPVVASLGDLAASGGYYVAVGAKRIVAHPSTMTGSIGIFYGKLDVSGLLAKIGVTLEASERGRRAGMESWTRPYTDEERAVAMDKLRQFYGRFLDAVGRGRAMPSEKVDAVGRGRVWTGAQARARGLVDRAGGIFDAVDEAKALAGMRPEAEVDLVYLPEEAPTLAERLVSAALGGRARERAPAWPLLDRLPASVIAAPDSPQARLDFDLRVE